MKGERLLDHRLEFPRLMTLAKSSEPTFVVVGVLHMVGPTGLPALLRQSGCEVVPVDVTGE